MRCATCKMDKFYRGSDIGFHWRGPYRYGPRDTDRWSPPISVWRSGWAYQYTDDFNTSVWDNVQMSQRQGKAQFCRHKLLFIPFWTIINSCGGYPMLLSHPKRNIKEATTETNTVFEYIVSHKNYCRQFKRRFLKVFSACFRSYSDWIAMPLRPTGPVRLTKHPSVSSGWARSLIKVFMTGIPWKE